MPVPCRRRVPQRLGFRRRVAVLLLSGLPILAPLPAALSQETPVAQPVRDPRFATHIAEASRHFSIPEHWIRAVLAAESAHDVRAVSSAGAMGLMQVMPGTWGEMRARHRLGDDPFDPRDNILAGTAYLREMLDRYGNVGGMLAAYNAGPARYDEYLATGRPLPAETRDFVAKLAPLLAGKPLRNGAPAAPKRTDWRKAPLFVAPPAGGSPDGSPQRDGGETADSVQGDYARPPSLEGIFVARSESGSSQ
jgi:Transglycosylase SLT domain